MALGVVDFSGVDKKLNGTYEGQTEGWEAKPSKAGDSINVIITFSFADEEGNTRKHPEYYSMKPNALWRAKRDLVAMGADPADFESTEVDLESILNKLCSPPGTPVSLTFEFDSKTGFNDLVKVEAA
jgi:hypothetical protein